MTEKDTCGQCIKFIYYKDLNDPKGYCTADIPIWVRSRMALEEFGYANEVRADYIGAQFCNLFNGRNTNR